MSETTVTTWSCERCAKHGELEFPKPTPFFEVELLAAQAHHALTPECRSQTIRLKLYDANRQLVTVKR